MGRIFEVKRSIEPLYSVWGEKTNRFFKRVSCLTDGKSMITTVYFVLIYMNRYISKQSYEVFNVLGLGCKEQTVVNVHQDDKFFLLK